jgi:hypothetical protein
LTASSRVVGPLAGRLAREVVLEQHRDLPRPLGDLEQITHSGLLLDLLLEDPLQELLALVIARLARDLEQAVDLDRDPLFLLERVPHRRDMVREVRTRLLDRAHYVPVSEHPGQASPDLDEPAARRV